MPMCPLRMFISSRLQKLRDASSSPIANPDVTKTLFISDLHLDSSRPSVTENFIRFLKTEALQASAVYILGDFFEVWAGDDDPNPHHKRVMEAMSQFTQSKIPLYFMRGNRDFLIDQDFAKNTGCILIPDPTVIELYGRRILLMHGDSLCSDDRSHQRFRKFSQNPIIRKLFLMLVPFRLRLKIASGIRKKSMLAGAKREMQSLLENTKPQDKALEYKPYNPYPKRNPYDVNPKTVAKALKQHKTTWLIHGHTHKASMHEFIVEGIEAKRIVLGEWGITGSALVVTQNSMELKTIH
jgi:UDP-2,3-diacylglucosamine hydrolase